MNDLVEWLRKKAVGAPNEEAVKMKAWATELAALLEERREQAEFDRQMIEDTAKLYMGEQRR